MSFYGLHLLEMEIWRRPDDLAKVAGAEAMREQLVSDIARVDANDNLQEYHGHAAKNGTTLPAALGKYVHMEHLLRTDFDAGLKMLAQKVGINLVELAEKYLAEADDAVALVLFR